MALGKPSPVSIGLSVIMLIVVGYLIWQSTSKTNTQNYDSGSTHTESNVTPTTHVYPMGCARMQLIDTPDGYKAVKDNNGGAK